MLRPGRMNRAVPGAVALLVAGCLGETPLHVADMRELALQVTAQQEVTLAFPKGATWRCMQLDAAVKMTANGMPAALLRPGGVEPGLGPFIPGCRLPAWSLPREVAGAEALTLIFTDGVDSASMTYDARERQLSVGAELVAGQTASAHYEPASDSLVDVTAFFSPDAGAGVYMKDATGDGGRVDFLVPVDVARGSGTLSVNVEAAVEIAACSGFQSCAVTLLYSREFPVEVR